MYDEEIDINYRYICLITFAIILLFSNNIITYAILLFIVILRNVKKETALVNISFIFTFIALLFVLFLDNYLLLKVMIIIDYCLYFLDINSINNLKDKKNSFRKKGEKIDNKTVDELNSYEIMKKNELKFLRFNNTNDNYITIKNKDNVSYVVFHLIILFISILIGSCAI